MKPELVQRNETVTLIYEVPGVTLTVRGKALEAGAEGDAIGVLNEQSKRTIQGVVIAPGRLIIPNGAPKLAANLPPAAAAPAGGSRPNAARVRMRQDSHSARMRQPWKPSR